LGFETLCLGGENLDRNFAKKRELHGIFRGMHIMRSRKAFINILERDRQIEIVNNKKFK